MTSQAIHNNRNPTKHRAACGYSPGATGPEHNLKMVPQLRPNSLSHIQYQPIPTTDQGTINKTAISKNQMTKSMQSRPVKVSSYPIQPGEGSRQRSMSRMEQQKQQSYSCNINNELPTGNTCQAPAPPTGPRINTGDEPGMTPEPVIGTSTQQANPADDSLPSDRSSRLNRQLNSSMTKATDKSRLPSKNVKNV